MSVISSLNVTNSPVDPGVWELASGLDALYMSGKGEVPESVFERLQIGREVAEEADGPVGLEFGGVDFEILPRGLQKYRYRLEHPFGVVAITPSAALPPVRIQPRSEFMHRVGPEGVVRFFRNVIERELGKVALGASRLDLYIDLQGWDLRVDDRHNFVRRATKVATHEDSDNFNGLVFGTRGTNTVYSRIYDKTIEIGKKGGLYVEQTWGPNYDPSLNVRRVEYQIGRAGLKQFGIDSVDDAINAAPGLWHSLTCDWLTYRIATEDSNRSRWPIAPEWRVVQGAKFANNAIGLERMIDDHARSDLKMLRPGLTGYVSSVTAIKGGRTIDEAGSLIAEELRQYERETGILFKARVSDKRGARSFTIPRELQ